MAGQFLNMGTGELPPGAPLAAYRRCSSWISALGHLVPGPHAVVIFQSHLMKARYRMM